MRLESVRQIKAEVFREQTTKAFAARQAFRRAVTAKITSFPARPARVLNPVALGIAKRGRQYVLAIRVSEPAMWLDSTIEALRVRCRGEVDVRYIGRIRKQQVWYQSRNRPLRIGSSIGPASIPMAGTLGCFASDRGANPATDGHEDLILSNNHVLADENRAKKGAVILQPGRLDGGKAQRDRVATLERFVRLKGRGNVVDGAVARLDDGIEYYHNHLETLGDINGVRASFLEPGETVYKVGRTTGVRKGVVGAIEVDDVVVGYDSGNLAFDNQIEIKPAESMPFSQPGDSGSLIVDGKLNAVGLLFAGNGANATFANPIAGVLESLGIDLVF